ncbi:hypothetical protein NE237_006800 [Protea cynaroides]|uniref:Uncharacterized protein n=1 Tax=Protea cynaroides TaxID=273540 RepID=A0A9Q0KNX5_9MAGN|nr:hypothetical protein NE237_006800 [Protea cynaroides]
MLLKMANLAKAVEKNKIQPIEPKRHSALTSSPQAPFLVFPLLLFAPRDYSIPASALLLSPVRRFKLEEVFNIFWFDIDWILFFTAAWLNLPPSTTFLSPSSMAFCFFVMASCISFLFSICTTNCWIIVGFCILLPRKSFVTALTLLQFEREELKGEEDDYLFQRSICHPYSQMNFSPIHGKKAT